MSGPIPESFRQLDLLLDIDLSNNQLTGLFPAWVHDLTHLEILNLQQNQFSGEIPDVIGRSNLMNIRSFIRLLSTPDASVQDTYAKLNLNVIKKFYRKYDIYIKNSNDLLWVTSTPSLQDNSDVEFYQTVLDKYMQAKKAHFLTDVYQIMKNNPLEFVGRVNLHHLNRIWQNIQPGHRIQN